jgi:hypothetical protein
VQARYESEVIAGSESEIARPDGAWVGVWRNGSGVPLGPDVIVTVRHAGAEAEHVGGVFRLAGEAFEVVAIHGHPDPHVDLAVLRVAGKMPHVAGIAFEPQPGELIVGGGTGVIGTQRAEDEYAWSGEQADSISGWENGERRELWARGAVHRVGRSTIRVAFSARSFAGTMSDSGAPILRKQNDGYRVLGLACDISGRKGLTRQGDETIYLRLDRHAAWLDQYR